MTTSLRHALLIAAAWVVVASAATVSGGVPAFAQTTPPESDQPAMPAVAVTTTTVNTGSIRAWLSTEGTARAVRREILHFQRSGRVVEIGTEAGGASLREGSSVFGPEGADPGQLIARIDTRQAEQQVARQSAQARAAQGRVEKALGDLNSAKAALRQAEKDLSRTQQLVGSGVMPRKNLQEAESERETAQAKLQSAQAALESARAEAEAAGAETSEAQLEFEQTLLRAPFEGVIAFLNIQEGDFVSQLSWGQMAESDLVRTAAAVVIDPTEYEILAEVPSSRALTLKRGLYAQVTWAGLRLFETYDAAREAGEIDRAAALPVAEAEVYAVAPAIAPDSRAVRVRLRTTTGAEGLRDGLYVAVRIEAGRADNALLVPVQALRFESGQAHVFVVEDGVARRRPVSVGMSDGRRIVVTDGLAPGLEVVTEGQDRLFDGAPVTRTTEPPADSTAQTGADQ